MRLLATNNKGTYAHIVSKHSKYDTLNPGIKLEPGEMNPALSNTLFSLATRSSVATLGHELHYM